MKLFRKRHTKIGAHPGALSISPESPAPRIHVIRIGGQEIEEWDIDEVDDLESLVTEGNVTWIDVQGFGDRTAMRKMGQLFHLHPLLLADVVNVPQRPKSEAYGDQLLMVVRMVKLAGPNHIDMEQVSVVLGNNYVLTFQERYGDVLDPVRERLRSEKSALLRNGADYLCYALVDTIVDAYYPVLEKLGDHLEELEDEVIENPTPQLLAQIHGLRNELVNLRRVLWPEREALNSVVRGDFPFITELTRLHFRDTYDHCAQTSEVTEMYREMATGLMNTYLSAVANRTNEVMKVLTIVATIFIPLTFLAGIYGMNFQYMPELHVRWAYPMIWIVMFLVAAGMTLFFWRKGWLGGRRSK